MTILLEHFYTFLYKLINLLFCAGRRLSATPPVSCDHKRKAQLNKIKKYEREELSRGKRRRQRELVKMGRVRGRGLGVGWWCQLRRRGFSLWLPGSRAASAWRETSKLWPAWRRGRAEGRSLWTPRRSDSPPSSASWWRCWSSPWWTSGGRRRRRLDSPSRSSPASPSSARTAPGPRLLGGGDDEESKQTFFLSFKVVLIRSVFEASQEASKTLTATFS